VPDSGRTHALGYSEASGIPYDEGLIKNRYIGRTFILPSKEARELNVQLKLNAVRARIRGRRVVLVDDSIVRGTTMRKIVDTLRKAGATEVHVRIGSPPIVAPCYLGIDMKTRDQFVAVGRTEEEIAKEIGADSVGYLSIEGLVDCIGIGKGDLCLGCLTGEYPVEIPGEKARFQAKLDAY
jgi:amidophosphoribosyltransferase